MKYFVTLTCLTDCVSNTWYHNNNILQNNDLDLEINRNTRKGIIEGDYKIYAYNRFGKHFKDRYHRYCVYS